MADQHHDSGADVNGISGHRTAAGSLVGGDELIERLEKATGPDRELDEAIAVIVLTDEAKARGETRKIVGCIYASPYTSSIDAAITLVPDGGIWDVTSSGSAWVDVHPQARAIGAATGVMDCWFDGRGKSPAIALCIAALKARTAIAKATGAA